MSRSYLAGVSLFVAFALLWLPLGQQAFLYANWMKVGVFMMPFLVFVALSFSSQQDRDLLRDPSFIALILLSAYIVHQFEEHWIDLYGNVYAFQNSVNAMVHSVTGAPDNRTGPLSVEAIFVINTSLVWLLGAIAIWQAARNTFPILAMAALVLVNAISHIAAGLVFESYNPGLLSSVVLFVPIALWVYWILPTSWSFVVLSLVWAILAHIIMVIGMMASTWWNLVPPVVYFAALVIWSLTPLLVDAGTDVRTGSK
ncbi:MAG: HXXEE domain-containing protein [Pseudomonadota bacterium]